MVHHSCMTIDPQFKLRLPSDLKARLEAIAAREKKSLTAVIVQRLEESFPSLLAEMISTREAELRAIAGDLAVTRKRIADIEDVLAAGGLSGPARRELGEELESMRELLKLREFLESYCQKQLDDLLRWLSGDKAAKA